MKCISNEQGKHELQCTYLSIHKTVEVQKNGKTSKIHYTVPIQMHCVIHLRCYLQKHAIEHNNGQLSLRCSVVFLLGYLCKQYSTDRPYGR